MAKKDNNKMGELVSNFIFSTVLNPIMLKIKIDIHDNVSIPITTNSMYIEVVFKISLLKTL